MSLELYVNKMLQIEKGLGCERGALLRVAQYESGNNAKAVNRSTNAVGVIQFMPNTLRNLGWRDTPEAFQELTEEKQADYVRRYMATYNGRCHTLADVYLAVFAPAFIGSDPETSIFERDAQGYGGLAFRLNANLDENGDGRITPSELAAAARKACRGEKWTKIARLAGLGDGAALQTGGTLFWLQAKLLSLGFDPGPIDGTIGPKTTTAIKAFQKSRKLTADGIVGPNTRRELER